MAPVTEPARIVTVHGDGAFGGALTGALEALGARVARIPKSREGGAAAAKQMLQELREVSERLGGLDALVYVLPEVPPSTLHTIDTETWRATLAEIAAMFRHYRVAARVFAQQRRGSLVGVHSLSGTVGDEDNLTASVADAAMVGMSRCLAQELVRSRVSVNTVSYGHIEGVSYAPGTLASFERFGAKIGVQRMGTSADVAAAVELFASPRSAFITGQTIQVSGGMAI